MDHLPPFDLPSEVVTKILQYLSFGDRRRMALVNTTWNHASMHPMFMKKETLAFRTDYYHLESDTLDWRIYLQMLINSKRQSLRIDIDFKWQCGSEPSIELFNNLGARLIHLQLSRIHMLTDSFIDAITSCCKNLRTLVLHYTDAVRITDKTRDRLPGLQFLTLEFTFLTDKHFNILIKCFPNLNGINIQYTNDSLINNIRTEYGLQMCRYEMNNQFTTTNFVRYLNTASSMKSLKLGVCSNIFHLKLPDRLKLRSLQVHCLSRYFAMNVDLYQYVEAIGKYTCLQRYDTSCCSPYCILLTLITKFVNLEHLAIKFHPYLTHLQCNIFNSASSVVPQLVQSINSMKSIRSLTIETFMCSNPFKMSDFQDKTLKSLLSLNCPIDNVERFLNVGKHLTSVVVPNGDIFTAVHFKLLFTEFIHLKSLIIRKCVHLNDDVLMESPVSYLKELTLLEIHDSKLTYRCFRHIKLKDLKHLKINAISVAECINKNDLTDFVNSVKELGSCALALTTFDISVPISEFRDFRCLLDILKFDFKSLFKKMYNLRI